MLLGTSIKKAYSEETQQIAKVELPESNAGYKRDFERVFDYVGLDYKTKRKPQVDEYMYEYYLQTTCYAQMFEEVTGQKINQVVILVSSEKNTRQEFIKPCDEYVEPMNERIEKYYLNN